MNKTLKIFSFGVVITLLTACSKPELDTSSDEAMKASIQEIMTDLPPEKQKAFEKAITGIYVLGAMASLGKNVSVEQAKANINEKLNGKTADDIFVMADEIREKMNGEKK